MYEYELNGKHRSNTINKYIRKMKYIINVIAISLFCVSCGSQKVSNLSQHVNPFIGASTSAKFGMGKTFPGATTPYGMVQVSPQTITGGDNGPGYSYEHKTIEGFAFTQMSGVGWYGDLGNFLTMPTTGKLQKIAGRKVNSIQGYRSLYDKRSEEASAGYYSVMLTDYNIKTEATAAPHCGILRFTYPANTQSRIQIDLARRVGGTSTKQYIQVKDQHTIRGWMQCPPDGGGWGNGEGKANYTVYFYAVFSKPLNNYGFWSAEIPEEWSRKRNDVISDSYLKQVAQAPILKDINEIEGKHIGFFTEFETEANEKVTMKVGISFVDMAGAENNYKQEIADKTFDKIRKEAVENWNYELSRMEVKGGSEEEKTIFYTALYHTMIDPRIVTDVDGRYTGGDGKVYEEKGFNKRTIFSGWDVFRSQFPLQTLINPEMVNDEINSLVSLAEQSGHEYYDRWELLNAYSGCMVGNPALSVLTDAYMKGIRGYDVNKAYQYARNTANRLGNGKRGYTVLNVSKTLEYAYSDWCLSQLATTLGHQKDASEYQLRGQNYRNTFDAEVGWFRPRHADGVYDVWPENARILEGYGCVESNLYQQGWFVPHDIPGMVELMGGKEKTLKDLSSFFEKTPDKMPWNQYYNHSNEPVHLVPFLFNHLDTPWLTQKWTRHICEKAYKNSVDGIVGNEDAGQMSAWYVLAAAGIHPSCPGTTRYEITSPVFNEICIYLDPAYFKGKKFVIKALNNSPENRYIQKARLNNQEYNKCYLDFKDIVAGGILELTMGTTPNQSWGVETSK